MKRTNPKKGMDEDPRWMEITWDEALEDLVAKKLLEVREKGLVDENGYPRVSCVEGSDGVCPSHYGTLPVIFGLGQMLGYPPGIWGPTDISVAQGGGVKCYHTEHLLGELWHKAFCCGTDTPLCRYEIAFGRNDNVSGGVAAVRRHAEARARGYKRVQVEPHLSVTGATADDLSDFGPVFLIIWLMDQRSNSFHMDFVDFGGTIVNSWVRYKIFNS